MSLKAIGIMAEKVVPLNVIQSILNRFPKHHLYLINPDFSLIN